MKIELKLRLMLLLSLVLIAEAYAEEKNFGKSLPSAESVIEEFKTTPPEAVNGESSDESAASGFKARGLKKIGMGHAKGKPDVSRTPAQHAQVEKAISLEILFDYNSATLTSEAKLQLVPVGGAMASPELKGLHYRIEGHTDAVGGDDFNIDLSRRRAEAVKEFLISQYGLAGNDIEIVGKGKNDLADKNNPASEANRRVRIVRLVN